MANTKAQEVFDSFESSFKDKNVIPDALELVWLKKAIGRYSIELDKYLLIMIHWNLIQNLTNM